MKYLWALHQNVWTDAFGWLSLGGSGCKASLICYYIGSVLDAFGMRIPHGGLDDTQFLLISITPQKLSQVLCQSLHCLQSL